MNGTSQENLCVDIGAEGVKSNQAAQWTVDVNFYYYYYYYYFYLIKPTLEHSIDAIFIVKARLVTSRLHELKLKCAERAF